MPYEHYGKWRARWLDESGNQRSATYDDFRTADYIEKKKKAEVEEIRRGLRSPHPPDRTVSELLDYWKEKRAPRKRSEKDDVSIIERHLRPYFGEMLVREVGVEDGDDYVGLKMDDEGLSDKYVHNHLTLFGTMLRAAAAFKVPWLLSVPKFNKPKISLFSTDYQWLRTLDEIRRFLIASGGNGRQRMSRFMTPSRRAG
jgi:hypothetical protein